MTAITYLKKAHDIAKEGILVFLHVLCINSNYAFMVVHIYVSVGGDSYQEGLACYRLGNAFEGIGEHDTAIQVCVSHV